MTAEPSSVAQAIESPEQVRRRLDELDYLVDDGLATALFLSLKMGMPLLLEGEPGVGKTSAAKALAAMLGSRLVRLQCYEGLTAQEALYEWNYQRQLLAIRLAESHHESLTDTDLFTSEFLDERPLLACLRDEGPTPPVLLIDEIDRADDEFEALLLEFLGEASVTIPEIGTITAKSRPIVILTSNRSRELHDALRRRCLYHWIEFPEATRVTQILRRSVPEASTSLIEDAAEYTDEVRDLDLDKVPGMAEAIDWVRALTVLGVPDLSPGAIASSLGTLVKTPDDREIVLRSMSDREAS